MNAPDQIGGYPLTAARAASPTVAREPLRCAKCACEKPADEFHKQGQRRHSWCKSCFNAYARETRWCVGVLASFRTPEVLQSKVHGRSVRWARNDWHKLGDDALSCPQDGAAWPMLALWQAGCDGRAPQGWQPPEQLARELVAHLSELPRSRTSAARFLLGLWRIGEGLGLLREALSTLQEAWRPAENENQSARITSAVRRLTPIECERLMGFPDSFTRIPYRGKPASECPDGPRYKALGNSMAVPVMAFIGQRIEVVRNLEHNGGGRDI